MAKKDQIAKDLKLNHAGWSVLMLQIKSLQGAHGFYKHFHEEMRTLKRQLKELEKAERIIDDSISLPEQVDAMSLTRSYFKFISNIHPYPHHLTEIAEELGIVQSIYLKTNVFERFLHAVDKIDPNFYQNPLHRQEVKNVLMQTLEDLYDELEEREEEAQMEEEDYL